MKSVVCGVIAAVALAALALDGAAADEAPSHGWEGFGVGSSVRFKVTTTLSDPSTREQLSVRHSQRIATVASVTSDALTIRQDEIQEDETKKSKEKKFSRKVAATAAPKPQDVGKEKLDVDGEAIECRKQRTVSGDTTTIRWISETYGMLKEESKGGGVTSSTTVTTLARKMKVGDAEMTYREEVKTFASKRDKLKTRTVTRYSAEIPGGVVRSEHNVESPDAKFEFVDEAIAFEKK